MRFVRNALGLVLLALLPAAALATTSTAISHDYVYAHIGSTFRWSGATQGAWSGDNTAITYGEFKQYIANDGTCGSVTDPNPNGYDAISLADATACATTVVAHSPLVGNPTFTSGLSPWTSSNTGGCAGTTFTAQRGSDEDGDGGLAGASSSTCAATPATVALTQTFSISAPGAVTAQTYQFWYEAPSVQAGDPNCTQGAGAATFSVKVNGTTVQTGTASTDGAWHKVNGNTTLLANGSNTFAITATLTAATGTNAKYNRQAGDYLCIGIATAIQPFFVDNVSLGATY